MTTAARPTFDPAKGGTGLRDKNLGKLSQQTSSRDLPAHLKLKERTKGQDTAEELEGRDFKAELEARERLASGPTGKVNSPSSIRSPKAIEFNPDDTIGGSSVRRSNRSKANLASPSSQGSRTIQSDGIKDESENTLLDCDGEDDKDSYDDYEDDEESDEEEEEDEEALLAELEKVRQYHAQRIEREEQERKEKLISSSSSGSTGPSFTGPSSTGPSSFSVKRPWDDDVPFKNCARGEDQKKKPTFINDTIRSESHRKFMDKYIR